MAAVNNFNISDTLPQMYVGQEVTIFTVAGGTGGGGYTGTIISIDADNVYLLLVPAAAPTNVVGAFGAPGAANGSVTTIPLNQISSVTQSVI
ncbi:hypothetical protein [Sulfoacidibacillus ferrooxidans]|uniref:Uncharacterized protein n=1 Tax=Sulfoacidibacillus ferrooxidans TaxID=2005001 RepID=A0A9X1VBQ9_9BACL|nr:hypothetical protein [Sulfoacidibacillus ferrooxidans]MCI0184919.1 hypothetical protein [Sulfoacidibacillus ferrooxidans]